MTENTQLPKVKWKDNIEKKENNARFVLDQILAMKEVFTERLDKEMTK